jgi:effector-binding domain-containing protein
VLKKLAIAMGVVAALAVIVGLWLPTQYRVERGIEVARPASTVFELLNGFQHFNQWSPWAELDPDAEYRLSGPATGVGAKISWVGDPRFIGTGWQEITASQPYRRIDTHLDFGPQGMADAYFLLGEWPDGVHLTWGFSTDVAEGQGFIDGLVGRYLGLFLDDWIGDDYELGLARFKEFAESLPARPFDQAGIQIIDVIPTRILYVSDTSSQAQEDIVPALAAAFGEISAFLAAHQLQRAGQPMAITRAWDETGFSFDAAIPVEGDLPPLSGRLETGLSPGGRAVRIVHHGPYENILESYEKLAAFMAVRGLREGPLSWEHYLSDPAQTPPGELLTHIYIQLAD